MPYVRTIVCLANSWKTAGRCIAGKDVEHSRRGEWVRPVSERPTHEISEEERRYSNGRSPQVLEVIRIPCLSPEPLQHQPENHKIDPTRHWECVEAFPIARVRELFDQPTSLWGQGSSSMEHLNNRIPEGTPVNTSLYLIPVASVNLIVGSISAYNLKRGVKAEFTYGGIRYRLKVTDPILAPQYLALADGNYTVNRPALCISLGEEYGGFYYKLVATIIQYEAA